MRIGFFGLGQMGKPMAMNLIDSGAELIVGNRSGGPLADFERKNVQTTSNFARVAEADIVFLCLPSSQVVESVLFGADGILKHPKPGQIVVDTSTIGHAATVAIAARLKEHGMAFLDAPVSGMPARAMAGTLTVMCGGDPGAFAAARPYLECLGSKLLYMGGPGSGQLTKLINQLLFDINVAALAEILPMAVKLGLDPVRVGEVVNSGTGRSQASEFFIPRILANDFSAGYPMAKAYKDLESGSELAASHGIPLPVLAAATATYQAALQQGYGDLDKGGMIRVFEDRLGVLYRG